jgi:ubiquitin-protein ligase
MSKDGDETFMPKSNQKRLAKDIIDIMKDPLENQGIYYSHDDNNMLRGYAMIFGPCDTIYEHGIYLFEFKFPSNYPYSPPKLTYLTNDGKTRFNPNLYRTGKVCLSLLNTWKGEQWTSCQSIRTILLVLISILHNKPLLNEPGVSIKHKDFDIYNKIIQYSNFKTAILRVITKEILPNKFNTFFPDIKKHILSKKKDILDKLKLLSNQVKNDEYYVGIYSMRIIINYKTLIINMEKEIKLLENTNENIDTKKKQ